MNFEKESTAHLEYEFDYQPISDPSKLENVNFEEVLVMSLYGCQIKELKLFDDFMKKCPKLKVLWLNDNPVCKDKKEEEMMRLYIEENYPNVELFNSKFTKHCTDWGIRFVSLSFDLHLTKHTPNSVIKRIDFSSRNLYRVDNLIDKLKEFTNVNQVIARDTFFDSYKQANTFLDLMKTLPNLKSLELDYYMLDLFWKIGNRINELYPHFEHINGYNIKYTQPSETDLKLDRIVENLWRTCGWFSFQVPETDITMYSLDERSLAKKGKPLSKLTQVASTRSQTVFYLNDELGSYIRKTLLGNVKLIPVIRFPDSILPGMGTSFSLLFITGDISEGEELVQSIGDSPEEVDNFSKILDNNILFGEHAMNEKVDYLQHIMEKFKKLMLKLSEKKEERKAELVKEKIKALIENPSGKERSNMQILSASCLFQVKNPRKCSATTPS